jgi:hypothetical protein
LPTAGAHPGELHPFSRSVIGVFRPLSPRTAGTPLAGLPAIRNGQLRKHIEQAAAQRRLDRGRNLAEPAIVQAVWRAAAAHLVERCLLQVWGRSPILVVEGTACPPPPTLVSDREGTNAKASLRGDRQHP